MLANHVAAEINQRWTELDQLPTLLRLNALESIIERHILATGPYSPSSYVPDLEDYSDFVTRGMHGDSDQE